MNPIQSPWPFKVIDGARLDFAVAAFVDAEAMAVSVSKWVKQSSVGRFVRAGRIDMTKNLSTIEQEKFFKPLTASSCVRASLYFPPSSIHLSSLLARFSVLYNSI
ncbi:hypothetical protein P692DRAFT_201796521 [Suillus brevipes Sb2]|nr:hypothetical protein P692DRAFT_201796521 [Suillus brevipes Sb2]